ncbi:hypothetical protein IG193_04105 [Infirmifilum lucidum]|uniref:Helicase ATP-binding domain-containing protein n=1 Tax=Infirmifilum lucidum TaxID=2776706 RepID=A0A7L9FLD4_9CREN|nr:helicase C-terminal domain-containing protein [Infirmifilum lucidum]QOJ79645.1 hypothetical protein IG193_04105 [Infirmifilum lucidum]
MNVAGIFEEAGLEPREKQLVVAQMIAENIHDHNILLVAPPGWGKTLAVLAALKAAKKLPSLWLVRALTLGARVSEDAIKLGLRPLVLAGREKTCPFYRSVDDLAEYCRLHRAGCPHFRGLLELAPELGKMLITSYEDVSPGVCKYYIDLFVKADIVIQNYHRRRPATPEVTVIDEAHNLTTPQASRFSALSLEIALDAVKDRASYLYPELEKVVEELKLDDIATMEELFTIHQEMLTKTGKSPLTPLVKFLKALAGGGVAYREGGVIEVYHPPLLRRLPPTRRVFLSATIPKEVEKVFNSFTIRIPAKPRKAFIISDVTSKYGQETVWGFAKILAALRKHYRRNLVFSTERILRQLLHFIDFYEERLPSDWQGVAAYNIFGRFSEGVDIRADTVTVLGTPYLPPDVTPRYRKYFEGLGIGEPEIVIPVSATLQAVGRATRHPQDNPLILLADYRFRRFRLDALDVEEIEVKDVERRGYLPQS